MAEITADLARSLPGPVVAAWVSPLAPATAAVTVDDAAPWRGAPGPEPEAAGALLAGTADEEVAPAAGAGLVGASGLAVLAWLATLAGLGSLLAAVALGCPANGAADPEGWPWVAGAWLPPSPVTAL